jgi:hypothetical protein
MALDPGDRFLQGLLSQTKEVHSTFDTPLNQFRLLEHFEMTRNGGLSRAELLAEVPCAARRTSSQRMDHRPTRLVRKSVKCAIQHLGRLHS